MTRAERLRVTLRGEETDRPAFAVWQTFRPSLKSGPAFVEAILAFQSVAQSDLMKIPPAAFEDLATIRRYVTDDTPIIATIAADSDAEWGRIAVEEIGCVGVFVPIRDNIAANAAKIFAAASGGWCNILHLHGAADWEAARSLREVAHVVSWNDKAVGPTLGEGRQRAGRCVMGGLNKRRFAGYSSAQIESECADALRETNGGRGLILAPGCALPLGTPQNSVRELAMFVRKQENERVRNVCRNL